MPIQKNWRISYHDSIADEDAIYPYLAGIKIYDDPLVGFASADDELFGTEFKKEGVIHPEYLALLEWLHARISPYISTWSERHAMYAAGLGTFGLSKGLITKKGMARLIKQKSFLLMDQIREYVMAVENVSVEFHVQAVFPKDNFLFV